MLFQKKANYVTIRRCFFFFFDSILTYLENIMLCVTVFGLGYVCKSNVPERWFRRGPDNRRKILYNTVGRDEFFFMIVALAFLLYCQCQNKNRLTSSFSMRIKYMRNTNWMCNMTLKHIYKMNWNIVENSVWSESLSLSVCVVFSVFTSVNFVVSLFKFRINISIAFSSRLFLNSSFNVCVLGYSWL